MSTGWINIFFSTKDFKQDTLAHSKRSFRAEFSATEAANAAAVVKFQLLSDNFYYSWRTASDADAAKNTPAFYLHRPGCQMVSQAVFDKAGKTEFYIGDRWKLEGSHMQTTQIKTNNFYRASIGTLKPQFLCLSLNKQQLLRNSGNLGSNDVYSNRISPGKEQADMTRIATRRGRLPP